MKKAIIAVVAIVGFFGILAMLTMGQKKHRVEVCMEFQGRQSCRTASGPTREQAQRTATDNACALIASGMTDSMACQATQPIKVEWK
jgi:hypothetical protein